MSDSPLKQNIVGRRLDASRIITKLIPADAIEDHPENYNGHPSNQLMQLAESHAEFGQYRTILVWARPGGKYIRVLGHGYSKGAQQKGETVLRCEVLPEDTDPVTVKGIMMGDNLHAKNSIPDDEALASLLQEQQDAGYDLASLGTDDEALRQLLEGLGDGYLGNEGENEEDDFEAEPDEEQTRVKLGDVWKLGEHRLMVGDSTKLEDVQKLMQGDKADLIVTSPPYWVGREYEQEHGKGQIIEHIESAAKSMASIASSSSHIAINTGTTTETKQGGTVRRVWLLLDWWSAAFERHGWYMRNVRIWAKHGGFTPFTPVQDVVDLNWEFLASFTREKPKPQNKLDERWALDGIWDCQPQTTNVGHSAPFPVEIPSRYIALYTAEQDIVFEPYCGSGTTLIACEQMSRKCRGIELDPTYGNLILTRWEQLTGEVATLLERVEEATHA